MISADLHLHTHYSHGRNSAFEMHAAAERKGLALVGFTEHSPRPAGYDYAHEYRERLTAHFPDYIREVSALKEAGGPCQVLLGLEMDWLPGEEAFIRQACAAHDYDYLIGSVHFLGRWGFDDGDGPWREASEPRRFAWFEEYFEAWRSMLLSGLFQIAAHPDLIKIHAAESFHRWLERPASKDLIRRCLLALREAGMAMEISTAGLRKPCREIYPCPAIMRMAKELDLNVSVASDAHNADDVAHAFPELSAYAKKHGFEKASVPIKGRRLILPL